tara:strand:- start:1188 stop:1364 length:177 start_codon:yes stop_codon:yes gene_type:complete
MKKAVKTKRLFTMIFCQDSSVNDPKWICNDNAPKGWGEFYSDKLKKKDKRKQLVKNKA